MNKKTDFKNISFSSFEDEINKKEIYLKYIDDICKNTIINKDIIIFFINNNGNIEDVFKNINILSGDQCYVLNEDDSKVNDEEDFDCYNQQLILPNNLEFKNNIIKNSMLYNIAHYCVLNNFNATNLSKNPYNIDIFHINNQLFKKRIMIKNNYETSLFIEYNIEDFIPKYCDHKLIESNEYKDLLNEILKELDHFNFEYSDHTDYIVEIDVSLTDCLETNIKLIDDFIKNTYSDYTNKIKKLKKNNEKYFKKQLTQQKVKKF
jgi:hypothetical protein